MKLPVNQSYLIKCFADEMIDRAFPFRIAMFRRCFNQNVSLLSPVFSVMRFPISLTMTFVQGPNAPEVSIAIGSNWNLLTKLGYFLLLSFSAFAAACPTSVAVSLTELSPNVLTHVASHQSSLPRLKQKVVIPFGRFLSPLLWPIGSNTEGIPTVFRARQMISFKAACRGCRPSLN